MQLWNSLISDKLNLIIFCYPDEPEPPISLLVKFMEILDLLESTMDDTHKKRIEKQLRQQRTKIMDVCTEISNLLTLSDPHSEYLVRFCSIELRCKLHSEKS